MSMAQWWNDTDRRNLKYWQKIIIQSGWYMDECVWSKCWNDTDWRKLKYWEKNIIQSGWYVDE